MKPELSTYFEGILQIRDTNPEIVKWVHNRVIEDGKARITKEKKVTNGVDLYFNDQHYLQNIGRKVAKVFPGTVTVSRRLHTVNKMTSKLLYIVNVLFKPHKFKRGDIVHVLGEDLEIVRFDRHVHLKNPKTGERKILPVELVIRNLKK